MRQKFLRSAQLWVWCGLLLSLTYFAPASWAAADCTITSSSKLGLTQIPLTSLGTGTYQGFEGGLYAGGGNVRPSDWESAGQVAAANIYPRDSSGARDDVNGKIILLSIGMSNAAMEFGDLNLYWNAGGTWNDSEAKRIGSAYADTFAGQAEAAGTINPQLVILNGAQSGKTADKISNLTDSYWTFAQGEVTEKGFNINQVQAVWLKEAIANPTGAFPASAETLQGYLESIARNIKTKFPNVQIAYVSSRIYGGYSDPIKTLNPEPYAYESAFAVKWLIEKQRSGDQTLSYAGPTAQAPYLAWGPYLWGDGTNPRSDGLVWQCNDIANTAVHACDGIHPSRNIDATVGATCAGVAADPVGQEEGGIHKVGAMLLDFFTTDATTCSWLLASPGADCGVPTIASPTPSPNADVNNDGLINAVDVKAVIAGFLKQVLCSILPCDLQLDGKINAFDVVVVIKYWLLGTVPSPSPTTSPQPSATPGTSPSPGTGIPFAPFHFGNSGNTDYNLLKDGVYAGEVFTGAFLDIGQASEVSAKLGPAVGRRVVVNLGTSNPCVYWSGDPDPVGRFAAAVNALIPSVAPYKDRIAGILLLNEPDNPDAPGCSVDHVTAFDLYSAALQIRPVLEANGFSSTFPLGFGVAAGPYYFTDEKTDWWGDPHVPANGKVNFTNLQFATAKLLPGETRASWVAKHLGYAAEVGHKVYFTVNADPTKNAATLPDDLEYICGQIIPDNTLMVGYWKWDNYPSISLLQTASNICAAR